MQTKSMLDYIIKESYHAAGYLKKAGHPEMAVVHERKRRIAQEALSMIENGTEEREAWFHYLSEKDREEASSPSAFDWKNFKVGDVRKTEFPMETFQRELFAAVKSGIIGEDRFIEIFDKVLGAHVYAAAEEAHESHKTY